MRSTTTREDFVARVKEITGGKGLKVVYDSVGADTFARSLDCLQPFGLAVNFGNASGNAPPVDARHAGRQGLALCDATDPVHPPRHAREHAGDGRRPVRRGAQRRGQDPHRPALCARARRRRHTANSRRARRPAARSCYPEAALLQEGLRSDRPGRRVAESAPQEGLQARSIDPGGPPARTARRAARHAHRLFITRRISSTISSTAPTLIALSATLNDGKYQPPQWNWRKSTT